MCGRKTTRTVGLQCGAHGAASGCLLGKLGDLMASSMASGAPAVPGSARFQWAYQDSRFRSSGVTGGTAPHRARLSHS